MSWKERKKRLPKWRDRWLRWQFISRIVIFYCKTSNPPPLFSIFFLSPFSPLFSRLLFKRLPMNERDSDFLIFNLTKDDPTLFFFSHLLSSPAVLRLLLPTQRANTSYATGKNCVRLLPVCVPYDDAVASLQLVWPLIARRWMLAGERWGCGKSASLDPECVIDGEEKREESFAGCCVCPAVSQWLIILSFVCSISTWPKTVVVVVSFRTPLNSSFPFEKRNCYTSSAWIRLSLKEGMKRVSETIEMKQQGSSL